MDIKSSGTQTFQHIVKTPEEKLHDVATLYEKQFLREMVKQMRTTVGESGLVPHGMGEKIFQEQLDQEYVEKWGDRGGIGLGKLIEQQLISKYGAQMGITHAMDKPKGPIVLGQAGKIYPLPNSGVDAVSMKLEVNSNVQNSGALTNPWAGKWLGSYEIQDASGAHKQTVVDIEHPQYNLKSRIVFRGESLQAASPGQSLKEGDRIGSLGKDSNTAYWQLLRTSKKE